MAEPKKLDDQTSEAVTSLIEELELSQDDFDKRVMELLATFPVEQQRYILKELRVRSLMTANNC